MGRGGKNGSRFGHAEWECLYGVCIRPSLDCNSEVQAGKRNVDTIIILCMGANQEKAMSTLGGYFGIIFISDVLVAFTRFLSVSSETKR